MSEKKALIEAALFMSPDPISLNTLEKITGITSKRELESILQELKKEYEVDTRGIELAITPEGYHLKVKEKFSNMVAPLTPHTDLSGGALRTLALVALRQPIAQSQIIKIQGNKAYGYIEKLEKKGLIVSEKASRTKVLKTTKEFERYFGKSLKDIQENLKAVFESEANIKPGTEGNYGEIKAEDFTGENK
ncbi:MAG: SMC-Scp complex subunit ScpB [Candidatus Aenigmatarchaeota archaeon]